MSSNELLSKLHCVVLKTLVLILKEVKGSTW